MTWDSTQCPACGAPTKAPQRWLCETCVQLIRGTEEAVTVNRLCAQHLAAVEKLIALAGMRAAGVG